MNATSQNGQYDTTPPAPAHLESGLRKLRARAAHEGPECYAPNAMLDTAEAAALLAKIEAADRLADSLEAITRRVPVMGSTGNYRQGQLDALKECGDIADATLADYHNPAHRCGGAMNDRVEFYLDKHAFPFCWLEASFQPNDGDLVNIRGVTYIVLGRSFSVDESGVSRNMRCNVIVEKHKP